MPSVRIRDSAFLQPLRDDNPPTNNDPEPTPRLSPRASPFLPHMRTMPSFRSSRVGSTSPQLRSQRGRSGSTASRVHDHCIRSCARYSATDRSSSVMALPLLSSSVDDREGALTTSTGTPSIRHTNADSIRATYGSEMHHDDVIEHLDVIGRW